MRRCGRRRTSILRAASSWRVSSTTSERWYASIRSRMVVTCGVMMMARGEVGADGGSLGGGDGWWQLVHVDEAQGAERDAAAAGARGLRQW